MWNPTLGLHGGWDTAGVETVSVSVDRTNPEGDVAVCRANTMGTFAVVAEVNILFMHDIYGRKEFPLKTKIQPYFQF